MFYSTKLAFILFITSLYLLIGGCGGSSDGNNNSPTNPDKPKTITLIGVAAAGLPLVGIVNVKGANDKTASAAITTDGSFSLDVTDLTAPYILFAKGSVNGRSLSLYSAAVTEGVINITPITDFILRYALAVPLNVAYKNWSATPVDSTVLATAERAVQKQFKPVLEAAGVNSNANLLTTSFTTDRTGLDLVLDMTAINYVGDTATVTNTITGASFTDSISMVGNAVGFPATEQAAIQKILTDGAAIELLWQSLSTLYSNKPSAQAISDWLTMNLSEGYLWAGSDKSAAVNGWTQGNNGPPVGVIFTTTIVNAYDASSAGYSKAYTVNVQSIVQGKSDSMTTIMVFDGNRWFWHGDQRWVSFSVVAQAFMFFDAGNNTDKGNGLLFITDDEGGYAYNQGVKSAMVSGPGLEGGIILTHAFPKTWFTIYTGTSNSGLNYNIPDNLIATIPINAEYTINLCSALAAELLSGNATCDNMKTYTAIIPTPPLLSANLNASMFATQTSFSTHNINELNFGGNINVNWTLPSNREVKSVYIVWSAMNVEYKLGENVLPDATSVIFDTSRFPAADSRVSINITVRDNFAREFTTIWSFNSNPI